MRLNILFKIFMCVLIVTVSPVAVSFQSNVYYQEQKIGTLTVNAFAKANNFKGVRAHFDTFKPLKVLAGELGISHFNWYQVVQSDVYGAENQIGYTVKAPYIDPLCGGFGANSRSSDQAADSYLPYYAEFQSPGIVAWALDRNHLSAYRLTYKDEPAPLPSEMIYFHTYLVGVSHSGAIIKFLAGFSWASLSSQNGKFLKIQTPRRLKGRIPYAHDFDFLLSLNAGFIPGVKGMCWWGL